MEEEREAITDRQLAGRIIDGVDASGELQDRFRKKLELHLIGHCARTDGRSREKSVEIASQVLADCFARSPSLLEKWQGNDNLEAFLRTVAHNRLKSWWESRDAATEVDSGSRAITAAEAAGSRAAVDWEELAAMERALAAGVEEAMARCPEGLVFLRLKGLHGVDQRVLAGIWGWHEAQTSRRIKEAMTLIRETAAARAAASGMDLEMDGLQTALQGKPSILLGASSAALAAAEAETLRKLALGRLNRGGRDAAVALMCRNAVALEFFAQLLNRKDATRAVVARDLALDGLGALLNERILRTLEILSPAEAGDLVSPLISDLFADALHALRAGGGTLWWLSPGEAALEAVFNPLEPEIAGMRQPLAAGIISLVLATGETVCTGAAESHRHHSAAIDSAMGKSTASMIAVPFRIRERLCGVLTAVRFPAAGPFGAEEAAILERQALAVAALMDANLSARIAGMAV